MAASSRFRRLVSRPRHSFHEFRGERVTKNLNQVAYLSQKFETNFWGRTLVSRPRNSFHEFRGERATKNLNLAACLSPKFETNFWGRALAAAPLGAGGALALG